jgi:predicted lipid-binding transport protein (Tim44 family)
MSEQVSRANVNELSKDSQSGMMPQDRQREATHPNTARLAEFLGGRAGVNEEGNKNMPSWYNQYQMRGAQEQLIDEAFEDEDLDKLSELCAKRAMWRCSRRSIPSSSAAGEVRVLYCAM